MLLFVHSVIEPLEARVAPAFSAVIDLSMLNGSDGFKIHSEGSRDPGFRVSDAGDLNGDGFGDIVIGDPRGNEAYVLFGKAGGIPATFDLSTLNGSNGFTINAQRGVNFFVDSVSSAGDVNGDGYGDLFFGRVGDGAGGAMVVFGKAGGYAPNLELTTLDGKNGFVLKGATDNEQLGRSISPAGDVNGDGYGDLLFSGITYNGGNNIGAAYVVFGKANGFDPLISLAQIDGTNSFKITRATGDAYFAYSVSGAGDINGDGFDDLLIGAGSPTTNGAVYLVYGKAGGFNSSLAVTSLNGSNGFTITGDGGSGNLGRVGHAGDLNSDGFDDIVLSASTYNSGGAAFVIFGKAGPFAATSEASVSAGSKIYGHAGPPLFGLELGSAGDINGDGIDDLFIGGLARNSKGVRTSTGYVVFGKEGAFPTQLNADALNGKNGFRLNGLLATDFTGISFSGAGDFNGDGFDDLLIAENGNPFVGELATTYVVYGKSDATVSIANATMTEGNAGTSQMAFAVTLSNALTVPVSVHYSTQSGTAGAGSDFTGIPDTLLTFAPGEISKTILIDVKGDSTHELNETFNVILSDPINLIFEKNAAVGAILDNDAPPLLSIDNASRFEGDTDASNLMFTVTLTGATEVPVYVSYKVANGTANAGTDYNAVEPGLLTFAPGETAKTITVTLLGDYQIEAHETFSVLLFDASHALLPVAAGIGTILNDDTAVHIESAIAHLEGNTGMGEMSFNVTLEKASALPVTVAYASADGTAHAGGDYMAVAGQIIFAPGETHKSIKVVVPGDFNVEEHETFSLLLSGATNATIGSSTRIGTILNDDTVLHIDNAVSRIEGDEGTGEMSFNVTLEKASALPVTVTCASVDGTAHAGEDYRAVAGQIIFAPGQTTQTIQVAVFGDFKVENHERFTVILSGAVNAGIATNPGIGIPDEDRFIHVPGQVAAIVHLIDPLPPGAATATILNDDTLLQVSDAAQLEGHEAFHDLVFTVSLTAPSALPVSVTYNTADSSATGDVDYVAAGPQTLTFAPGETSKTVIVKVVGDTTVESIETLSLLLSGAVNASIHDGTGLGVILDDDVTLINKHKIAFTDVDGDRVTVKTSKGRFRTEDFTIVPSGVGAQLALIDLGHKQDFAGANLKIRVRHVSGSSSNTHVGYIDATGIDLGKVSVDGDLGRIDAGDAL
ncbi:MAG: Calx-beta domain-containing protein, partial [Verrucomicrobiota bacterium]